MAPPRHIGVEGMRVVREGNERTFVYAGDGTLYSFRNRDRPNPYRVVKFDMFSKITGLWVARPFGPLRREA